jgi:hypothetical protein
MLRLLELFLTLLFLGFLEDELLEGKELLCLIDLRVLHKVFVYLINRRLDTALTAVARFGFHDLPQPINSGIVYGFSNIKAKVEPTVVRPSKNSDDTMLLMLSFRDP